MNRDFTLRPATAGDIPALHALIEASVRGLQAADYSPAQLDGALGSVLGLDTQLIRDGTYFVAEPVECAETARERWNGPGRLAGCGGWSRRKTLFGATTAPDASLRCSTPPQTPPKSAPSSCIPISRGAAWDR